ncbi:Forkhead box protein [Actinidia chinensis var. chinensis]|uniref:Forkhead box protein n=1 Tax=Actinidia chinensis var. chinensis TaxID=1590841 RepID=A0A2R6S0Q2_ACTCC|nr:Forkhead box protein [Actinidia chinensis var. chinensis]
MEADTNRGEVDAGTRHIADAQNPYTAWARAANPWKRLSSGNDSNPFSKVEMKSQSGGDHRFGQHWEPLARRRTEESGGDDESNSFSKAINQSGGNYCLEQDGEPAEQRRRVAAPEAESDLCAAASNPWRTLISSNESNSFSQVAPVRRQTAAEEEGSGSDDEAGEANFWATTSNAWERLISNNESNSFSKVPPPADSGGDEAVVANFWTACPFCYNLYEYPRAYVDCCLRCQNCQRAFQAVALATMPPLVPGKEAYYCYPGFFPKAFGVANGGTPAAPLHSEAATAAKGGSGANITAAVRITKKRNPRTRKSARVQV